MRRFLNSICKWLISTILLLALCFVLMVTFNRCGTKALNVFNEICSDIQTENEELTHGENRITNTLDETYTVKYQVFRGFRDMRLKVEISSTFSLLELSLNYKKGLKIVPTQILRLFREGDMEYYFAGSEEYDFIFAYDYTKRCGEQFYFKHQPNSERDREYDLKLAETFRRNITRDSLLEKIRLCGYNSEFLLEIYDYNNR